MTEPTRPGRRRPTAAVHGGREHYGDSLAPPIWATSTFVPDDVGDANRRATTPREHRLYSRYGNPSVRAFEDAVTELEGAGAAIAFASGMGAITTTVLALVAGGQHVVVQRQVYASTVRVFRDLLPRYGVEVTVVDHTDTAAIEEAVRPGETVLLFVESPANPTMSLVDLEAVGAIAGPIKVMDSTFATPMMQRPLEHGFDLVVHSGTKALAGHNDATIGVAAGPIDLVSWIWGYHTFVGATASPYDATNALRGLRTLPVRVRHQSATALRLAEALEGHAGVGRVWYPGLDSHPQRDLAKRQLDLGGTVVAFDVGSLEAGDRFTREVRLGLLAPSLGGPETLVSHPASMTHVDVAPAEREAVGITDGLIRVSVGLEDPDDVIDDIVGALGRL